MIMRIWKPLLSSTFTYFEKERIRKTFKNKTLNWWYPRSIRITCWLNTWTETNDIINLKYVPMQNTRWVGKSNSLYFWKGTDIWSKVKRLYHLFLPWIVLRLNEAFFRKKNTGILGTANFCSTNSSKWWRP